MNNLGFLGLTHVNPERSSADGHAVTTGAQI
jgi:hypothetical protein